jgi:hypothetical protein
MCTVIDFFHHFHHLDEAMGRVFIRNIMRRFNIVQAFHGDEVLYYPRETHLALSLILRMIPRENLVL